MTFVAETRKNGMASVTSAARSGRSVIPRASDHVPATAAKAKSPKATCSGTSSHPTIADASASAYEVSGGFAAASVARKLIGCVRPYQFSVKPFGSSG